MPAPDPHICPQTHARCQPHTHPQCRTPPHTRTPPHSLMQDERDTIRGELMSAEAFALFGHDRKLVGGGVGDGCGDDEGSTESWVW